MIETQLKTVSVDQKRRDARRNLPPILVAFLFLNLIIDWFFNTNFFNTANQILLLLLFAYYAFTLIGVFDQTTPEKNGFKNCFKILRLQRRLQVQLQESGVYFQRRQIGTNAILVDVPDVKILFNSKDMISGKVFIKNSIKFQDKLEKLDISSSLKDFYVESAYLSKNRDYVVYIIENVREDSRLTFSSISDMKTAISKIDKNNLLVDKKLSYKLTHSIVTGQTGSGKSYFLYNFIIQMLLRPDNYKLWFVDPKNSSIRVIGDLVAKERTASTTDESVALLKAFLAQMNARKKELYNKLNAGLDKTAQDFGYQNEVLIIDEFAALQMRLDKKQRAEFNSMLTQIILEGRALGFFVFVVLQQANAQLISTNVREQMGFKAVLGNSGTETYITLFGQTEASEIPQMQVETGEGFYMLTEKTIHPREMSAPTLNFNVYDAIKQLTSEQKHSTNRQRIAKATLRE